jgi:2-polyprenyl-6-methoxyphenol hydroxylase-like FAD-dependent oxidoreductase
MTTTDTTRAVVLGAGFAGLLAARVLADHYAEVLVVDRDDVLTAGAAPRRGVPQGTQVHGMLLGGREAIERLLPGWTEALAARGAIVGDVSADVAWWFAPGRLAHLPSGMTIVAAGRPLLEDEVRRRVAALRNVRVRGGTDAVGVTATPDGGRVTGVRLVDRRPGAAATTVPAGLVVDATGRGSRTPAWLADLGHPPPPEERLDVGIGYVSRWFPVRPGDPDLLACVVALRPPEPRSGVLARQEGDRWILTLGTRLGHPVPDDLDGFRAFAGELPAPEPAAIAGREPIGGPARHRFPAMRRRHYERCERLPAGLVVLGDAVCSFDPTFAHGMSVAALQAEMLQRELAAGRDGLERRVARGAAEVAAVPWALVSGSVRRFPGMPRKPLRERLLDRYLARLVTTATRDDDVAAAFLRVVNLVAPPPSLLAPGTARRVLTARTGAAGPVAPAALPQDTRGDLRSRDGRLAR